MLLGLVKQLPHYNKELQQTMDWLVPEMVAAELLYRLHMVAAESHMLKHADTSKQPEVFAEGAVLEKPLCNQPPALAR